MPNPSGFDRRDFMSAAAAGLALAGAATRSAVAEPTETRSSISAQPMPSFGSDQTTADILVETLIAWGATHAFGIVGDGINSIIEALRKRQDEIRYIGVRHEEAAAFMASGFAKHTGRLGVCVGTTGPGAIHLLNGLYDAALDGAPIVALTGLTFHDLTGVRYQQGVDTVRLMQSVALYNEEVTGPEHAVIVGNRACRAALGDRGVAHLTISKDVQMMKRSADKRSMRNPGRSHLLFLDVRHLPPPPNDQIHAAAEILNSGRRVAILAGQGALHARDEVTRLADALGAPVAKSLLGKAVLADNSPFTTGGIGDLGTAPSSWAMKNCDTVLILGSTMPWEEYYPTPGQARGIQIDLKADRIGLRYPVEVGLVGRRQGHVAGALLPLIEAKKRPLIPRRSPATDGRLERAAREGCKHQSLAAAATDGDSCGERSHRGRRGDLARLRGQYPFRGALPAASGEQRLTGTGMLATMAPGLPFAIAAQLAYPGRQSVAVVGDGGFAMLMAELSTAVAQNLPVKIILLKNNSLAEVKFEQKEIGNPEYGCDAAADRFRGFCEGLWRRRVPLRAARRGPCRPFSAALNSPRPALVEAVVDAEEKPTKPDELRA